MPIAYHAEGLDDEVLAAFGIADAPMPDLTRWHDIGRAIREHEGEVTIAIVGKYTGLKDAYKSLVQALHHGGIANTVKVNIDWIESETLEEDGKMLQRLEAVDGILVPGGFGKRGSEGMISAAGFARERKLPFFGICFGMQLAMVEAARNVAGISRGELHRVRTDAGADRRADDRMGARQRRSSSAPATAISAARCGSAPIRQSSRGAARSPASTARPRSPSATAIATRSTSTTATGLSSTACALPACRRTACCRRRSNMSTIRGSSASSIHPELKSRPFAPHPLFASFIEAAVEKSAAGLGRQLAGFFQDIEPVQNRVEGGGRCPEMSRIDVDEAAPGVLGRLPEERGRVALAGVLGSGDPEQRGFQRRNGPGHDARAVGAEEGDEVAGGRLDRQGFAEDEIVDTYRRHRRLPASTAARAFFTLLAITGILPKATGSPAGASAMMPARPSWVAP